MEGVEQPEWRRRIDQEIDNLRAALGWALETGNSAVVARITAARRCTGDLQGYATEGLQWIKQALAEPGRLEQAILEKPYYCAASLAFRRGDVAGCKDFAEKGSTSSMAQGPSKMKARCQHLLSSMFLIMGDKVGGQKLAQQVLATYQEVGDIYGLGGVYHYSLVCVS